MGWVEGLRGADVMSLAVSTIQVPSRSAPDDSASPKMVIIIHNVVYALLDTLCWFSVSDNNNLRSTNNEEKQSLQLSGILIVLRISTIWYYGTVIFGVLTIYATLSYSTNYLTKMHGMSLVAANHMGIVINRIFHTLCDPPDGIITTYSKAESPTRVVQTLSIVGLLALTALLVANSNPQPAAMGVSPILLLRFACYASRGLCRACSSEVRTPSYIVGITVGACSVIGFLPDVFVRPAIGHWQDTLPAAEAYCNTWLMGMVALDMVIVFTFLLFQKTRTADSTSVTVNSK